MIRLLIHSSTLLFNSSSTTVPNFAKPYLTFQTDRTVYLHDYVLCTRNWVYFAKFNTKLNIWPFCLQLLKQGFATGKCKTVSRCSISTIYCNAWALGPCEWAAPSFPSPPLPSQTPHTVSVYEPIGKAALLLYSTTSESFFNTFPKSKNNVFKKIIVYQDSEQNSFFLCICNKNLRGCIQ